jgi:EMAP domain
MGERVIPFGQNLYIERSDFFDTHGPEGEANGGKVPKGFKRLLYNDKVRLRYAYVIHCDEVVRDSATNEPVELKCTMFPETRAGVTPEGMQRVKGIIQWVEGTTAIKCTINQYDRLFLTEEPGKATGSFLDDVNPNSLQVLDGCLVEPSVLNDCLELMAKIGSTEEKDWNNKMYHSELAYQFERTGYFALDPDSTTSKPVFNRVVTLRDTWVVTQTEKKVGENVQNNRNRGRGENIQKDSSSSSVLEDIRRVAIRAATILEAEQHPDAENLVVCRVDCGDEDSDPRVVVASLGGKIMLEDLVNKKVACVTNLKPAKMRGIESTAMLLAASNGAEGTENIIELLEIPDSVPNGELLYFDSKERPEPDTMMKSKGALKAFDRVKSCLKVNSGGHAIFCDDGIEHAMLSSAGPVLVPSLTNVVIQ